MVSTKKFINISSDIKNYLIDFNIVDDRFVRCFNYYYDPNGEEGSEKNGIKVRVLDAPLDEDIIDPSKYAIVNNSIMFYEGLPEGSNLVVEVATDLEEIGESIRNIYAQESKEYYELFRNSFYGEYANEPTTKPDGSNPSVGDLYYDTTLGRMRVYSSNGWEDATYSDGDIDVITNNASNIETVATNIDNVNTTATNIDNVDTIATNIDNVNNVGSNITNVNNVATNIDNINNVANNKNNIDAVANNITDINNIANDLTNINNVANDLTNIDNVANNDDNIDTVATNITNVNTVSTNIDNVNITADSIDDVNTYAKTYQGAKTEDPTARNDGSSLQKGDLYFNTTINKMKTYDGNNWILIGNYTDEDILNKIKNVDGDGSGLDADAVDGKHCNGFWNSIPFIRNDGVMEIGKHIDFHLSSDSTNDYEPRLSAIDAKNLAINDNKIWHSGNDGVGSGLDADLVQGVSKNLLGLGGDGYQWYDETGNRSVGTTYTNTNGKPIYISIFIGKKEAYLYVDNIKVDAIKPHSFASPTYIYDTRQAIVPNGSTYKLECDGYYFWVELK